MDATVTGDAYVLGLARYIHSNEAKLSGSVPTRAPSNAPSGWLASLGPIASTSKQQIVPPRPLSISLHHLMYLLLRFEALGLPVESLDVPLPPNLRNKRPKSSFSYISAGEQRDSRRATSNGILNSETMSIGSVRTALSRMSVSAASTASWFSQAKPPDPDHEVRYIYSALTKIPAVNIVAAPISGLVEGFDDTSVPTTMIPFGVFKNLQLLSFTDVDPRTCMGWVRLSCQLKSLVLIRSGVEDAEELILNLVLEELKDTEQNEQSVAETGDSFFAQQQAADNTTLQLPSLSWHFLTNLGLPSSSLTFFPTLPVNSLRSLDLSHNLLNSIPPSLSSLPELQSLDLAGNLIEDCRGGLQALANIRVLNLRGNRIESLSGLEGLRLLRQIDLRDNSIYEASEVGRLAESPSLSSLWIKGNPIQDEYPTPRIEVLLEFAKDGWPMEGDYTITLDGEKAGYFERSKVVERLPLGVRLAPPGTRRIAKGDRAGSRSSRGSFTPRAEEREEEVAADEGDIVAVRHRKTQGSSSGTPDVARENRRRKANVSEAPSSHLGGGEESDPQGRHSTQPRYGSERRRNRRVIEFDAAEGPQSSQGQEFVSEAEKLKREVLYGRSGRGPVRDTFQERSRTGDSASNGSHIKSGAGHDEVTSSSQMMARPSSASKDGSRGQSLDGTFDQERSSSPYGSISSSGHKGAKGSSGRSSRTPRTQSRGQQIMDEEDSRHVRMGQSMTTASSSATSAKPQQSAADLRARIEGLKKEVGEDWMRVLNRGDT